MLHLPPAHHEMSKFDSPNETKIKKQNETIPDSNSNLAKSMTHHNQTKELTTWFHIGLHTRPHVGFLDLPLKTSLRGWHETWFYCENHEPSLPRFVGRLPEFQVTWSEEPTPLELPEVAALMNKVNLLKEKGLMGVSMVAHCLARRVQLLKKQIHPGWEYYGPQDLTQETRENITPEHLVKNLGEIFQDTSSWLVDE
jgi:hypothetical protein